MKWIFDEKRAYRRVTDNTDKVNIEEDLEREVTIGTAQVMYDEEDMIIF